MRHWLVVTGLMLATPALAQSTPANYRVGVVSESGDIATWLKPLGDSLAVERVVPLGIMPTDIDGPHNIAMAPDQRSYYVTIAHGTPFGTLWKLDATRDSLIGRVQVELFPTTISLTPDGQFAFVANSDFHGDHPRTNVLSVVYTPTMNKITDIPVCDMPHGVKVNHAGTKVYVSCMHSDEILEVDVGTFGIARRSRTGEGQALASTGPAHGAQECSPTFVSVSPDDRRLYVACNSGNSLQVWDAATLTKVAEIPVGKGAYNVEPSLDGKLVVVTNKKDQSISLIDAVKLKEIGRIATSKKIVHGVAFSPDRRLAFISSESIGADPGAVDVIDLAARKRVATTIIPGQPTGITVQRSLSASSRP
jgi:YVTN family beta-propeller protein